MSLYVKFSEPRQIAFSFEQIAFSCTTPCIIVVMSPVVGLLMLSGNLNLLDHMNCKGGLDQNLIRC